MAARASVPSGERSGALRALTHCPAHAPGRTAPPNRHAVPADRVKRVFTPLCSWADPSLRSGLPVHLPGLRLAAAGGRPPVLDSSVGNCFDNAVAESFFATLKREILHHQVWLTQATARLAIFEFIAVGYNRQRRHSTLGYATPTEYAALAQEVAIAYHQPVHET